MTLKKQVLAAYPRKKSGRFGFFKQLPINALMLGASAVLFVDMMIYGRFASFVAFLLALLGTVFVFGEREANHFFYALQGWGRKYKLNIALLTFSVIGAVFWLNCAAAPADAQFFIQTENWMRSSFPMGSGGGGSAGATDIYGLVFNTLRAIFVLYLAISLVRVIASARSDEDWQTLARTPLIILITVTLGDILAGLITGGGG